MVNRWRNLIGLNKYCLDPVLMSNIVGTLSYATAGPNTRTTQLFINYVNNTRLDPLGFAPLGKIENESMKSILIIFRNRYKWIRHCE